MKHQAADAMSRSRANSEETNELNDDLPLNNVENTQGKSVEANYVQAWTEWEVSKETMPRKPSEGLLEKEDSRFCIVKPTSLQTSIRIAPTVAECIVTQKARDLPRSNDSGRSGWTGF